MGGEARWREAVLGSLEAARELHDRHLMAVGLGEWDRETNLIYHTREDPYDEELRSSPLFQERSGQRSQFTEWSCQDRDLFRGVPPSLQPWAGIYVGQDGQRQALCQVHKPRLAGTLSSNLRGRW